MYSPVQQNTKKQYMSAFDNTCLPLSTTIFVKRAHVLLFPCVSSRWWVHLPRAVLFCQPHQQLFTHSLLPKEIRSDPDLQQPGVKSVVGTQGLRATKKYVPLILFCFSLHSNLNFLFFSLSPFLTGWMFVCRTYFGHFDELWFVS